MAMEKAEIKQIADYFKDLEEGLVEWDYRGREAVCVGEPEPEPWIDNCSSYMPRNIELILAPLSYATFRLAYSDQVVLSRKEP